MNETANSEGRLFAAAFFFVHDLFRPPTAEQWAHLNSDRAAQVWSTLAGITGLPRDMGLPPSEEEFEADYLLSFGSGESAPPVALVESSYAGPDSRSGMIHDNLVFYRTFGLGLRPGEADPPDHLRRQLEFVGFLYRAESAERFQAGDAEAIKGLREARGVYIVRHLLSWLPKAVAAARRMPAVWVNNFMMLAEELCRAASRSSPERKQDGRQG